MASSNVKDLIVLTADPQMQRTVETLLDNRQRALGIAGISFDVQRASASRLGMPYRIRRHSEAVAK